FRTHLRRVAHELLVHPPPSSAAPLTRRTIENVDPTETLGVELAPPRVVAGSVTGRTGEDELTPIGGAGVSVYESENGHLQLVGRTRADGDGDFRLVIAADR
ncbi:MAG: hypothetical protein ABEL76_05965, partial [Bradymonadaceae bacterium]